MKSTANTYRTIFHRDGTATIWDVYTQSWCRRLRWVSSQMLATLNDRERARLIRHVTQREHDDKD